MKFQSKPLEIPVVWRNYQKSLLSDAPLNSPTVSAAQGRSWAQLTSNLIHNGQECFQVFQGKISAPHEAQSSYRWYLSQEKCKIPKQGEQKKRKSHLMEENPQLLDCQYPYFCSSQHCWLFSLADTYGKKPKDRSVLVLLTKRLWVLGVLHGSLLEKNCAILE